MCHVAPSRMARSSGRGAQVPVMRIRSGRSAALRTPIGAFDSVHRPLCDKIVSRLADRLRQEAERKDGMSARSSKSSARDSGSRRGSSTGQARGSPACSSTPMDPRLQRPHRLARPQRRRAASSATGAPCRRSRSTQAFRRFTNQWVAEAGGCPAGARDGSAPVDPAGRCAAAALPYSPVPQCCTALHCTALRCAALHCTALPGRPQHRPTSVGAAVRHSSASAVLPPVTDSPTAVPSLSSACAAGCRRRKRCARAGDGVWSEDPAGGAWAPKAVPPCRRMQTRS